MRRGGSQQRESGDNKKGIGNYHSLRAVAPLVLSCQKQLPCLCFISLSLKMTLETLDFFFSLPNSLGLCTSLVRFSPSLTIFLSVLLVLFCCFKIVITCPHASCLHLKLGIGGCDLRQLPTGLNFIPGNSLFTFN